MGKTIDENISNRQRKLMERGYYFGKSKIKRRDELYSRTN